MRVTIKHREEGGVLPTTKRHYVDCTVLFSEEEKAIIRERGLSSHYIVTDPDVPPPPAYSPILATLLKAFAPLVFLGGCVAGIGMSAAGNRAADGVLGFCFFAALAMYLGGIALNRHIRAATLPEQTLTLSRLLNNPTFSVYAIDNARAKTIDAELRQTLTDLKDALLANREVVAPETFEL